MYYAVYEDGQCKERTSREDIFSLPGHFKVYSIDNNRIQFLPDLNTSKPLVINDFEVTLFNRHLLSSEIEIYDHTIKQYYNFSTRGGGLPPVLNNLIEGLEIARTFPSFKIYLEYENLKDKVERLEAENRKLKEKLRTISSQQKTKS